MLKTKITISSVITLLFLLPLAYTQKVKPEAIVIDGFTVTKVSSKTARIRTSTDGKYVPLKAGTVFKFPVSLKSNKSVIFITFSEGNTARLLQNTVIQLTSEKVKHPKLKLLTGKITLALDKFPKDHKIEVSTPTAVCGAVGTRFEVSYSGETKQLGIDKAKAPQSQSFACDKGEIYVNSESFHIGGIKKGQAVTTQNYKGKENSYSSVSLKNDNSASFHLTLPDKSKYVSTSASFEIAQPKNQKKDEAIAIIKVNDNNMKALGFFERIDTGMKPGEVRVKVGNKYLKHDDSQAYLDAAKEEGQLDTEIREIELSMLLLDNIDGNAMNKEKADLVVKRDLAAAKASKLAKQISQDRSIRQIIQQIRRNVNRQQMRNIKR